MKYVLPILIAIAALLVSGTAAYYSVTGLGKLFAGASISVMIMAASLEFSKLVTVSLLYRYWTTLGGLIKSYLTIAVVVLMLITSLGIYGFLTAAYQQTSNTVAGVATEVALYESQSVTIQSQISSITVDQAQLSESISELRSGLSTNIVTYTDKKGNVVTSTSSATRTALERQLSSSTARQTDLDLQLASLNIKLSELQSKVAELQIGLIKSGELGPLTYLSSLTGLSIDSVVNYLVLTIVFVFDPLAISLVIAANFAFKNVNTNRVPQSSNQAVDGSADVRLDEQIAVVESKNLDIPEGVDEVQPEVSLSEVVPEPAVEPITVPQPPRRGISRNAPAPPKNSDDDLGKRYW